MNLFLTFLSFLLTNRSLLVYLHWVLTWHVPLWLSSIDRVWNLQLIHLHSSRRSHILREVDCLWLPNGIAHRSSVGVWVSARISERSVVWPGTLWMIWENVPVHPFTRCLADCSSHFGVEKCWIFSRHHQWIWGVSGISSWKSEFRLRYSWLKINNDPSIVDGLSRSYSCDILWISCLHHCLCHTPDILRTPRCGWRRVMGVFSLSLWTDFNISLLMLFSSCSSTVGERLYPLVWPLGLGMRLSIQFLARYLGLTLPIKKRFCFFLQNHIIIS